MTSIGFTGTSRGITSRQRFALRLLLRDCTELHHGDCVGADAEAHDIFNDPERTVIHPPSIFTKRAWKRSAIILPTDGYLERNRNIVETTDCLIACPGEMHEVKRSGTWSTVRYARKLCRPITIVFPNGRIHKLPVTAPLFASGMNRS